MPAPNPDLSLRFAGHEPGPEVVGWGRLERIDNGLATVWVEVRSGEDILAVVCPARWCSQADDDPPRRRLRCLAGARRPPPDDPMIASPARPVSTTTARQPSPAIGCGKDLTGNDLEPVAPPTVPEGNLLVEGTPEGATALAALAYVLVDGESSPVLTITPAQPVPPSSVILACRAAVDWEVPATQPGPWQDKPLVDCGRSVNSIPDAEGITWTFPLSPLVSGTDVDVVLVPGTTGARRRPATSARRSR